VKRPYLLLILLVIISNLNVISQIVATPSSQCIGESFTFTYQSGSSLTGVTWSFGDGAGSQDLLTVQHSYSNDGSYTVTFDADGGIHDEVTITVNPNPTVNFSGEGAGCIPYDASFTDLSVGGNGSAIVSTTWNFGDGGSGSSPSHTYNLAGVFDVSLEVTDANGCTNSFVINDIVSTSPQPNPVITTTPTPPVACTAPLNVTFIGANSHSNSPSGSSLDYSWTFGNGNSSNVENPGVQTYDTLGSFTAYLTVTDNNGCSDSISVDIEIHNPTAGFEVGDTVCKEVAFVDTSSGGVSFWYYGDGDMGYSEEHTYQDTGFYQITQIVTIPGTTCRDTVIDTIFVEEPFASFTIDPSFLCDVYSPGNVIHFNSDSSSADVDSTFWVFGLDTIAGNPITGHYHGTLGESTLANPTDTVIFIDTTYSINGMEIFNTCLTVQTIHGCRDDTCIVDTIQKPNALFMTDRIDGCLPLTVEFSDSSTAFTDIVSFEWFWGDGTSFAGGPNDTVVSHTYNNEGIYNSYLVITTDHGCTDTSYFTPIYVGDISSPNFSISNNTVCPQDTVYFTDLTVLSDSIDYWHFTADNNLMQHCPTMAEPYWVFHSATGVHDISLTTCNKGCCTDNTISNIITVQGPICNIDNYVMDCETPFDYTFDGNVDDVEYWQWDFGDGTILSGLTNLDDTIKSHTYANTGNYDVILTAYNSSTGCSQYSDTIKVYVRDVKASLGEDSLYCMNVGDYFDASASVDVYTSCHRGYYWDFGDSTRAIRTDIDSINHIYADTGVFTLTLIVRDINLCTDTFKKDVSVYGVYAGFIIDSLYGCKPEFGVNFTDTSMFDYSDSLYSWLWDFGDGVTDTVPHPHHNYVYTNSQYFNVSLTVTDSIGCKDTQTGMVGFSLPDAGFNYYPDRTICEGDSVGFVPNTNDTLIFSWDFGDNDTLFYLDSATNRFYHTYLHDSLFTVSLMVEDSLGCLEYDTLSQEISVQSYPIAGFFTNPEIDIPLCYGNDVIYTDTSISKYSYTRFWDLEDGTPVASDSINSWFYDEKGTFDIVFATTTSNGCSDTAFATLNVVGPVADFSLAPQLICKGQDITFNISNMEDVIYYYFDFGDGLATDTISVNGQSEINETHTYNYGPVSGQTVAQLTIYSDDTLCPVMLDSIVYIHTVIADFDRNNEISKTDTAHCLLVTDEFNSSASINADVISWDFGDGTSAGNNPNPQHEYTQPGTYNVVLHIQDDESGCTDELTKQMIVFPNPEVTAIGGDTCRGDGIQIFATGTTGNFVWEPSTGLNDATAQNPIASPSETIEYTVFVSDTNDCKDTAITTVYIQQPPEEWVKDTTIIIGETFNLNGEQQGGYSYVWSPETNLDCTECPNPNANPQEDISYYLVVQDTMGCKFVANNRYDVEVLPVSSIDVPDVFTPNGDGDNDRIYVKGWGIKKLLEFSIYNRWGEKVYTSTDINEGWDGTYNGKPQNVDSYAYYVRCETYVDPQPITKKGTFTLIR